MLQVHQTYYRDGLYGLHFDANLYIQWARMTGVKSFTELLEAKYKLMAECLCNLIRDRISLDSDSPEDVSMRMFYAEVLATGNVVNVFSKIVALAVDLENTCFVVTWRPPRGSNVMSQFSVEGQGFRSMFLIFNEVYNILINLQLGPNENPDQAEPVAS